MLQVVGRVFGFSFLQAEEETLGIVLMLIHTYVVLCGCGARCHGVCAEVYLQNGRLVAVGNGKSQLFVRVGSIPPYLGGYFVSRD
jgi:hypothetical protein